MTCSPCNQNAVDDVFVNDAHLGSFNRDALCRLTEILDHNRERAMRTMRPIAELNGAPAKANGRSSCCAYRSRTSHLSPEPRLLGDWRAQRRPGLQASFAANRNLTT